MPAANLLTDEGSISVAVQNSEVLRAGAQDFSTSNNTDNEEGNCNVHVALFFLVAVGFIMVLRKNGFHDLMVEG